MPGRLNHLPNACFGSNLFQNVQPINTTYSYSSHLMSPIQYFTMGSPKPLPDVSMKNSWAISNSLITKFKKFMSFVVRGYFN